jgi:hypothetical protein
MWSTVVPSSPHCWHVYWSLWSMRDLIRRHWLVDPLLPKALAISNTPWPCETPTLCMGVCICVLYIQSIYQSVQTGQAYRNALIAFALAHSDYGSELCNSNEIPYGWLHWSIETLYTTQSLHVRRFSNDLHCFDFHLQASSQWHKARPKAPNYASELSASAARLRVLMLATLSSTEPNLERVPQVLSPCG